MTPRQADILIKSGKEVFVTTPLDHDPFPVILVSRDRWDVTTADGGLFDRGDLKIYGAIEL